MSGENLILTLKISIHAPREGGDPACRSGLHYNLHISIHAPREGGDSAGYFLDRWKLVFQSTPPARGATYTALTARNVS